MKAPLHTLSVLRLLAVGVLVATLGSSVTQAVVYTVGAGGDCNFTSLQAAAALTAQDPASFDILHVSKDYAGNSWSLVGQNLLIEGGYTSCSSTERSGKTVIYGTAGDSVLEVGSSASTRYAVSLRAMTLRGGQPDASYGGGIEARGNLDLNLYDTLIFDNESERGGGVYLANGASLVLDEAAAVVGNRAAQGAGIWCDGGGTIRQKSGAIASNVATDNGGGIWVQNCGFVLSASGVLRGVFLNEATLGGGIFCGDQCGSLVGGSVTSNRAQHGGGMYVVGGAARITDGSTVGINHTDGNGGGVYQEGGSLTVEDSTIEGNSAWTGGGIFAGGHTLRVSRSAVLENIADAPGGGVFNDTGNMAILSSTFSGNVASVGAGLYDQGDLSRIENSTFADNETEGGAPQSVVVGGSGTVKIAHTLLVGACQIDSQVEWLSYNGNAADTGTCQLGQIDLVNVSAEAMRLGPLADNGGPTKTHALAPGSVLVNAGLYTYCPETDQRGAPRIERCDPGAYEVDLPLFADGFESGLDGWDGAVPTPEA